VSVGSRTSDKISEPSRGMTNLGERSSLVGTRQYVPFNLPRDIGERMDEKRQAPPAIMLRQLAYVMGASRALYAAAELGLATSCPPGR
jgi:hypothetical protein